MSSTGEDARAGQSACRRFSARSTRRCGWCPMRPIRRRFSARSASPTIATRAAAAPAAAAHPPAPIPMYSRLRVIGQIFAGYIALETEEGLLLIDQHAAHERVTFEKLRRELRDGGIRTQAMLAPVSVELNPARASQVHGALSEIRAMGFDVEPFGPTTLLLKGAPAVFGPEGGAKLLTDMIESMGDERLSRRRRGRVRELAEATRVSRLGSSRASARAGGNPFAAGGTGSHRVQDQLPARTPGAYSVRTRANRTNVSPMSVLPETTAAGIAARTHPARIRGRLYCRADRGGQVRAGDGSGGALELRDNQRRLAAVLSRDGSRHGETVGRGPPARAASSYRRAQSRRVARRGGVRANCARGYRGDRGAGAKSAGGRRQRALSARDPRRDLSRAGRVGGNSRPIGENRGASGASRICISSCARSIPRRRIESASTTCTESYARSKSSS